MGQIRVDAKDQTDELEQEASDRQGRFQGDHSRTDADDGAATAQRAKAKKPVG
jgi:hypothetical protein